jgi:predicted ATPase
MILKSFRVKNFKCFRDSGEIQLERGFNVFVGQNNSGKTALLEALETRNLDRPHKSNALPITEPLNPICELAATFEVSGSEIRSHLLGNIGAIFLCMPAGVTVTNQEEGLQFLESVLANENICVSGEYIGPNQGWRSTTRSIVQVEIPVGNAPLCGFTATSDKRGFQLSSLNQNGAENAMDLVAAMYYASFFKFNAQRTSSGKWPFAANSFLSSDAANLPRAMLEIYKTPELLEELITKLNSVFSSIKWLVAAPSEDGGSEVKISVSAYEKANVRPDLLVPLSECGTGVGQVLAILFAAINFQQSKIILIDEPNSFLHPSAAKRLIEIFREYDHHQYILTTHSAEIIVAAKPSTLHHTKWTGTESIVENLSGGEVRKTQLALADIGVQISDLFGANEILWVEGQTEQMCFPKLIESAHGSDFRNTKVLALRSTSEVDHNRPSAKLVREIYETLSQSNALVPRAVGFRLDRESRTDEQINELESETARQIRFLRRKNYECYLIHPKALATVLAEVNFDEEVDLSQSAVENGICHFGGNKELRATRYWKDDIHDPVWLKHVDGAKLLQMLFKNLTNSQLEYKKTTHSVGLTEWLIANDPAHIQELFDFVTW